MNKKSFLAVGAKSSIYIFVAVFMTAFFFATPVKADLTTGLVGHWKMDEASWNGTSGEVKDASGNNNNGTATGGLTTAAGKYGNAGSFDGSNDYVDLGTTASLDVTSNSSTFSVWVKTTSSAHMAIYGRVNSSVPYPGRRLEMSNGRVDYWVGYSGGSGWVSDSRAINDGNWHHVLATNTSSSVTIYIDGVAGTPVSRTVESGSVAGLNSLIGKREDNSSYFSGMMDDFRIYSRAASALEISQLYENAPVAITSVSPNNGLPTGGTNVTVTGNNFIGGNDASTKLLLHGDGAGATFTDSEVSPKTIAAYGNATQSATQSKFGGKSIYFDGSGDYLSIPDSEDFNFGSGDFSIDFWFRPEKVGAMQSIYHQPNNFAGDETGPVSIRTNASNQISCEVDNDVSWSTLGSVTSTYTISLNTWVHVACVRSGNTLYLFTNGISQGTSSISGALVNSSGAVRIGYWRDADIAYPQGYFDEFRISKGIARWTSNFTPPITPYAVNPALTFGGTSATNINWVNATTLTATTPVHATGATDVVVTNSDGQSNTLANGFTFVAPPTITNISPSTGIKTGGDTITITGTNFVSTPTVTIGGTSATNVTFVNSTTLTVTTPAHSSGAVNVVVTNPDTQTITASNAFTYTELPPTVSSISPSSGSTIGGTNVTITGSNFSFGDFGTGSDGAVTIAANKNINTDTIASGRSCADAINYSITSMTVNSATLSATPAAGCLAAGDEILLINLQGTNTNYGNVGNYETLKIQSISGSTVNFVTDKTKYYGNGNDNTNIGTATTNQRVMLQRVPNYTNVTINNGVTVTANAWDGTKGGVLYFKSNGTVTNNGTISMSGKGYRGGSYYYDVIDAYQGESVIGEGLKARGANIGGGGGGGAPTSWSCAGLQGGAGGGGGSYGTTGANGGNGGTNSYGGYAGNAYGTNNLSQIFFGSGGGGSHDICGYGTPSYGAIGGGIIFIAGENISGTSGSILAKGNNGNNGGDGGGGAGSGGSIFLKGKTVNLSSQTTSANGGNASTAQNGGAGGAGGSGRIALVGTTITGTTAPVAYQTGYVQDDFVKFGTTPATNVVLVNSTTITATTPTHAGGTTDVVVTNSNGQIATLTGGFTYNPPPIITNISPATGIKTGGDTLTITGTNFMANPTVTFGSTEASDVTFVNSTTLTVTTPAHAVGAVDVTITNTDTQTVTSTGGFTYTELPPTITSVTSEFSHRTGGYLATITGTGFTGTPTVTFDGTSALVSPTSSTSLTVIVPAHAAGQVTVTLTNPDNQQATATFTYTELAPTITNISPATGASTGGTALTITGTNFYGTPTVTIGGNAATVSDVTSTTITATTPTHANGTVDVTVTNPDNQFVTAPFSFTYTTPSNITTVTSANYIVTTNTITNIPDATSKDTFLSRITKGQPDQTWDTTNLSNPVASGDTLVVTAQNTTSTRTYTLTVNAPGNSAIIPNESGNATISSTASTVVVGSAAQPITVTVNSGTTNPVIDTSSLMTTTTVNDTPVKQGVLPAINITSNNLSSGNNTQIQIPAGTTVTSTNSSWSGVINAPQVSTVTPPVTPGVPKTVTAAIKIGATQKLVFDKAVRILFPDHAGSLVAYSTTGSDWNPITATCTADTQVSANNLPAGSDCKMNSGTDLVVWTKHFTDFIVYNEGTPPTVTGITPNHGLITGGDTVTITGTNFGSTPTQAQVTFDGVPATAENVISNTQMTAVVPAHAAGAVTVEVTNPDNLSGTLINGYTYEEALPGSPATDDVLVTTNISEVLTISDASDVALGSFLPGESKNGNATWRIVSNSTNGWTLTIQASTNTALQSASDAFPNYTGPTTWTTGDLADTAAAFGFAASGTKADNPGQYFGFNGTTATQIAHDDSEPTAGTDTTVNFKAEIGSDGSQPAGDYTAHITATVTASF
jgi:hypothetical protein